MAKRNAKMGKVGRDEGGGPNLGIKTEVPPTPSKIKPGKSRGNSDNLKATTSMGRGVKIPHQVGASGQPQSAPVLVQGQGNTLGGFFPTNSARNQQDTSVKSRNT